jgi:hypothetical protein
VASLRHFAPQLRICLLIDGDFCTRSLRRAYDVDVLYRNQVKNDFLRERSFGYGVTKMVAFWESPFERFLWLDADTVMWGDISPLLARSMPWDIVTDRPRSQPAGYEGVSKWFFDVNRIEKFFPEFRWKDYLGMYFCTGVWAARRGVFELAQYQSLLQLASENPGLFLYGEMGLLNFMIASNAQAGRIAVKNEFIQVIMGDFSTDDLVQRFGVSSPQQRPAGTAPVVLHYTAGPKPDFDDPSAGALPMGQFRRMADQKIHGISGRLSSAHLRLEDRQLSWPPFKSRLRRKVSTWTHRFR